jgi:hypothetical protein
MKVFLQIVDIRSGISQHGMIEEPIIKGMEVKNALKHFGILEQEIKWDFETNNAKLGRVPDTTKVVSVITI